MKATGIVRRIDDLGRIVIPKEIRRQFHLREGDPMELFIEDDKIIFKRYSILEALDADVAKAAVKAIRKLGFTNAVIYDRDNVVAASCGSMSLTTITPAEAKNFSHVRKFSMLNAERGLWIFPILINGENQGYIVGSEADYVVGDNQRKATVSALYGIIGMLESIAESRSEM